MNFETTLAQSKAMAAAWSATVMPGTPDAAKCADLVTYLNGLSIPGTPDSSVIIITHPK